jgi:hypothetical protein
LACSSTSLLIVANASTPPAAANTAETCIPIWKPSAIACGFS